MQKTGLANHPSFLVWSGLEKGITCGCDHYGAVNNHFPVYLVIFGMVTPKRTNKEVFHIDFIFEKVAFVGCNSFFISTSNHLGVCKIIRSISLWVDKWLMRRGLSEPGRCGELSNFWAFPVSQPKLPRADGGWGRRNCSFEQLDELAHIGTVARHIS